ncbi:MAG: hypothetical protein ACE37F_33000 [Nannocystaceae bacterium]|nr:hypothetical protein [bacterium]
MLHGSGPRRGATWLLLFACIAVGCFDPDHGEDLDLTTGQDGTTGQAGSTGSMMGAADSSSSGPAVAESSSGGDDAAAQACEDYCALITDHCDDVLPQYPGSEICASTCANIPPGAAGDELGNSVACRTFHAILAAEGPADHCPHAGPAGDNICGADCESFCSIAASTCGELSPFAGTEDCIAQCEAFPADVEYSANTPDGDSYACRLRHLTLASLQPEIHCSHIATDSPVCFD